MHACVLSRSVVSNSVGLGTVARQAPLSMEFSRQEYRSGLPPPPPGALPNPGIKPTSVASLALAGRFFTTSATWKTQLVIITSTKKIFPIWKIEQSGLGSHWPWWPKGPWRCSSSVWSTALLFLVSCFTLFFFSLSLSSLHCVRLHLCFSTC